jgi:hypothetical protein
MRWAGLALAAGLAAGIAGCGGDKKPVAPPCPNFLLLGNAGDITKFRPGQGRDITDVVFRAKIQNFRGSCAHTKTGVEAEFFVDMSIERGPANTARAANLEYFVAIPKFHPKPAGKQTFPVSVRFGENQNQLIYRDEISIEIPLAKNETASDYDVYLGFQLSPEQLEFNRRRQGR